MGRGLDSSEGGRLAVVTGGSRGIGLAVARSLARHGFRLLLAGRDEATLERARVELPVPVGDGRREHLACACDVRDPAAVRRLFDRAAAEGGLEVVVNAAGVAHAPADVEQLPFGTWQAVLDANLTGTFLCCQAALPQLRPGGTIVNVISVAAREVFTGQSAYAASKAGTLALTNTLRAEVRGRGIRVVALVPGATDTPIWDSLWPDAPRERMIAADSVADTLVAALLLPAGATVTELVIEPTGGRL